LFYKVSKITQTIIPLTLHSRVENDILQHDITSIKR